jgi:hypothetical protein
LDAPNGGGGDETGLLPRFERGCLSPNFGDTWFKVEAVKMLLRNGSDRFSKDVHVCRRF